MANWGVPDYDTNEVIDIDKLHTSLCQRYGEDIMLKWPYDGPAGFDHATVRRYCVDTSHDEVAEWQRVRLSMKGKYTHEKLAILHNWWLKHTIEYENMGKNVFETETFAHVQVYNYLGALRRGGQLDDHNRIRKER